MTIGGQQITLLTIGGFDLELVCELQASGLEENSAPV